MADDDRISPMTQMRGVSSRPLTVKTKAVNPTTLGGTVEKLEMGMTGACHRAVSFAILLPAAQTSP